MADIEDQPAPPRRFSWDSVPWVGIALLVGALALLLLVLMQNTDTNTWKRLNFLSPLRRLVKNNGPFDDGWKLAVGLVVIGIVTAIVIALINAGSGDSPFVGAFAATSHFVPLIAAVGTIVAYIARYPDRSPWNRWVNDYAVLIGVVFALLIWLLMALLARSNASAQRANIHAYVELSGKLKRVRSMYCEACGIAPCEAKAPTGEVSRGCQEAWSQIEGLDDDLNKPGMRWVTGDGYTGISERLHRAEEALIAVRPKGDVIEEALTDEMRLRGSDIDHRDDLVAKLSRAVEELGGASYLTPAPTSQVGLPTGQALGSPQANMVARDLANVELQQARLRDRLSDPAVELSDSARQAGEAEIARLETRRTELGKVFDLLETDQTIRPQIYARAMAQGLAEPVARDALASVRRNINEYRDGKRDSLVHSRNDLLRLMTTAGVLAYLLLGVAVVIGVEYPSLAVASIYFLVGALFGGVVNAINVRVGSVEEVEDFKLSEARLLLIPLLSGLAALGGVVAIGIGTEVLTAAMVDGNGDQEFRLNHAFAFDRAERFTVGLVVAAIFGLSPNRLITRLNNSADAAKVDLKSTSAANSHP